ncbi:acyltransferase [Bacillus sp. NEB1478]|nr:acyltransferase [Bacillus sp. NEB1478]WNB93905.1 acyltransferase [Bacillus sp. NEB1478]
MRGLASLSVFFGHMYLMFNETFFSKLIFEFGLLRGVIAGSEAVTLFFVLSGFVLSLPFYINKNFNYGKYAIKRFFRIYVPYIIAIIFAFICREIFYTGKIEGFTEWFNVNWSFEINGNSIKDHILLIGTFTSNLNNVIWSLVHELRISLVFPILMFLIIKTNLKQGLGLAIILSLISILFSLIAKKPFLGTEFYYTIHCTSLFILGALLAKYRVNIINKMLNISGIKKISLFILGIVLYLYAHPSFILNIIIQDFNPYYRAIIDTWVTSFGAMILIVLAISPGHMSKILRNNILNFIGKISYSLYLTHLVVLFSCIHFLNRVIPIWSICLVVVLGTFVVSTIMYYLVEKPAITLGKFLTRAKSIKQDYEETSDIVKLRQSS